MVLVSYHQKHAGRQAEGAWRHCTYLLQLTLQFWPSLLSFWENLRLLSGPERVQGVCAHPTPCLTQTDSHKKENK